MKCTMMDYKSSVTLSAATTERIERLKEHLEGVNGFKMSRAQVVNYAITLAEKTNLNEGVTL